MVNTLTAIGLSAGLLLISLLLANLSSPGLRIWPVAPGDWRSPLFWGLFRLTNVSTLLLAAFAWLPMPEPDGLRLAAAACAIIGASLYIAACIHLGRDNLYCGHTGLVAHGLYAWSRNPQYALAMPSYCALAIASGSPVVGVLAACLLAIFFLMAIAEEPWLEKTYGEGYRDYARRVPRFYNFRGAVNLLTERFPAKLS